MQQQPEVFLPQPLLFQGFTASIQILQQEHWRLLQAKLQGLERILER